MLVSNDKGTIYFQDVIDVPEITGIHRCASFVKHQLDADKTEIYTDKLGKEILNDVYLNYCKINHEWGENPCQKAQKQCESNLLIKMRWNTKYNGR